MYPDLKNFRKELNSVGPWIIIGSYSWFLIWSIIMIFSSYIRYFDNDFNNAFPWFIETIFLGSIFYQGFYFYKKLKLGYKDEKDKIQTIVDVKFVKKTITPFLFLRFQLRYFLLLRAPYFIFIQVLYYQILDINGFKAFNFIQNLFFCILHVLFLLYDYFSFRETINKLSRKPIPLTPKNNYWEIFDYKSSKNPKVTNKKIDKKEAVKNNQIDKKDTMLKKFLEK